MDTDFLTLSALTKQFASIRKAYAQVCNHELAQFHFTPCEIDILIFLSNNANVNTAKELTVYLQVAKSLIARSIESLVHRGFLELYTDPHDRRSQQLYLCEEANHCISIIKQKHAVFSEQMLKGVSESDMITLQRTLRQISKNIEKGKEIE